MHQCLEQIKARRAIATVPPLPLDLMDRLAHALYAGGINLLEVNFTPDRPETWRDTADAIRLLAKKFKDKLLPGAGMAITQDQVQMAHYAGARFVVTSQVDVNIIKRAKTLAMLTIPSISTPTEAVTANQAGADAVRVFPAGALGICFFRLLRNALPHIPMLAGGGIDTESAAGFLSAGAIGFSICDISDNTDLIHSGDWERITELTRAYVHIAEG